MKIKVTNPKTYPLEDLESKAFASYLDDLVKYKKIKCFTHIPNETSIKNMAYLKKMKAIGKRAGVPDFLIIAFKKVIFIEMKRRQNENNTSASVISNDQLAWISNIKGICSENVYADICYGSDQAINYINKHL